MRITRNFIYSFLAITIVFSSFLIPISARALVNVGSGACQVSVTSNTSVTSVLSGSYCYVAFAATGSNTFRPVSAITSADFLIIAGGGAGGAGAWGGGGGAGGVVYYPSYAVSNSSDLSLSVGAGGTVGGANLEPTTNRSNNGGDSWINSSSTVAAKGGGAGASYAWGSSTQSYANGSNGGSGGGGTEYNSNGFGGNAGTVSRLTISGATQYGNNGGSTPAANYASGAGGGGAGAVGASVTVSTTGAAGGAGINTFSTWLNAFPTPFGVSGYIAGGGGGASGGATIGTGGSGGGGRGGYNGGYAGVSGTANTGSGGGGASYNGGSAAAGAGGSGLIIVRFLANQSPVITSNGGGATASISVVENSTAVTTATATDADAGTAFTFSISGTDSSKFTIGSASGVLAFSPAPNFEVPTDANTDNIYLITLTVSDGTATDTQDITITVTDVAEFSSIETFTVSANPSFRSTVTITVYPTVAGKVAFKANGVRIPNCLKVATVISAPTFRAICSWKPSKRAKNVLTAVLTPTALGVSSSSATTTINVLNRSGTR